MRGDPSGPTLQWHSLSGWKELPLGWYDPDEPGELESDPLLVDLGPGETRTIDLRFRLPEGYSSDSADYGGAVTLAGRSEGPKWSSRVQVPRWRIDQPTPTMLKVREPPIVTLGGAPAVYTVVVDNRRGRPQDLVRLDLEVLNSGVKPLEFATIEVHRAGSWQPVKQPSGRLTAPFAMPGGYRGVFTFRVAIDRQMGDAAVGQGGWLDAKVLLRHADQATFGPSLAEAHVETELASPTVRPDVPSQVVIGEPATFALTIENTTGVDYPPMHVLVDVGPYLEADGFTMAYQTPGETAWTELSFAPDRESLVARLPPNGGIDGADGTRITYRIKFTTNSGRSIHGDFRLMAANIDSPVYWDSFQPFPVRR